MQLTVSSLQSSYYNVQPRLSETVVKCNCVKQCITVGVGNVQLLVQSKTQTNFKILINSYSFYMGILRLPVDKPTAKLPHGTAV